MRKNTLIFVLLFYTLSSFAQPMSGNYTIGTGYFNTFNEAVNNLIANGVSGPTIFYILPGTYNENIIIPEISGASAINTITFTPKIPDSTTVTLISNNVFTVKFNGADYIRFLHFGIKTYSHNVFEFTNQSCNNIISNCIVEGDVTSSTSTSSALIYSSSFNDTNNVFKNTHFIGGSYGFYYIGSTTHEASTLIYNNIFDEQGEKSIYIEKQKNPIIANNIFYSNAGYYCIWIQESTEKFLIEKNNVLDGGIVAYSANSNSTTPNIISNNFVKSNYGSGIINHYCSNVFNVNNTVNIVDGPGYTAAFYCGYSNSNIYAYNNIFINSCNSGGLSILLRSSLISNYNSLFSTSNYIDDINNSTTYSFQDWINNSGNDINSINIYPSFFSNNDYHTSDNQLDGKGTPLQFVIDDIDGDVRNSTIPDIGADEFNTPNYTQTIINNIKHISPNPFDEKTNVYLFNSIEKSDNIYLLSVKGEKIEIEKRKLIGKKEFTIDKNELGLSSGFYIITFINDNGKFYEKIIIID